MAAPAKAEELDALFERLSPACELERAEERILFQADAVHNVIRIGMACTIRLHAHALAAAIAVLRVARQWAITATAEERAELFEPANALLNWAVGRDLQQWLKRIEGQEVDLDSILQGAKQVIPQSVLPSLSTDERMLGDWLFRIASAFILLHELGHLHFGHRPCEGYSSLQQEKDADRFALDWLLLAAPSPPRRLSVLIGISVAFLWPGVFNIFLGRKESRTHPEAYDRLFQELNYGIDQSDDDEYQMVWEFVATMLWIHMDCARFEFDERHAVHVQGDPRDEVNYLIDRISREDRTR